jgi:hypothetical protein
MSSGVVLRSQPSDFLHSREISEETKQSTDGLQNNEADHLSDSSVQNNDKQDLSEDDEEEDYDLCISDLLEMDPHEQLRSIPKKDSKANSEEVYELNAITWVSVQSLKIAARYYNGCYLEDKLFK